MAKPRKSGTVNKSTESKVNITEQATTKNDIVKFATGTQKQYNNKKCSIPKIQEETITTASTPTRYIMGKIETNNKPRKTHVVQWGESIQSIAGLYSVPVMKLIKLNGTTKVSVGQTIYID